MEFKQVNLIKTVLLSLLLKVISHVFLHERRQNSP